MSLNFTTAVAKVPVRKCAGARSRVRVRRGFTLVESMIATGLLGFSLVVMFGFHSQAVRSNLHARKMTDCTYLAQLQMERLIALPWSATSRPDELQNLDTDDSSSDSWTFLPHPTGGPTEVNAAYETDSTNGDPTYSVSWDVHEMDDGDEVTWVRLRVRCQYQDVAFNQWKGTTISSYRFRDS